MPELHTIPKNQPDVLIAHEAASGNQNARQQVTEIVDELIRQRTERLCKKFCYENRRLYQCTVDSRWGVNDANVALCEWGNDSYAWMLDDLTNAKRLKKFEGRNDATLRHYLSTIAHSHAFIERWKDWRFRRRDRVPTYIQELDHDAATLFRWLRGSHDDIPNIAQRLGRSEESARELIGEIVAELQKRNRLYLLDPPREVSLSHINTNENGSDDDGPEEWDIPTEDISIDDLDLQKRIKEAWLELDWREQYVLEALIIDRVNAKHVLQALRDEDIMLNDNTPPEQLNLQHVYYFCRKALAKLKNIADINEEAR